MSYFKKHSGMLVAICTLLCLMLLVASCGGNGEGTETGGTGTGVADATGTGEPSTQTNAPVTTTGTSETNAPDTTDADETEEPAATTVAPDETNDPGAVTYTVTVKDQNGNPVVGALIQLCTGDNCMLPSATDENGVVTFSLAAAEYKAQISGLPEGYTVEDLTVKYELDENDSVEIVVTLVESSAEVTTVAATEPVAEPQKYHSSIDHVMGKGPNGDANYSGRGGSNLNGTATVDEIDFAADGHTIGDDQILTIGGWMGVDGGISRYMWTVGGADAKKWSPVTSGGADGDPAGGSHFSAIGLKDAEKNALFNSGNMLTVDLSDYAGQTVDVTFAAIAAHGGEKYAFVTIKNVAVPLVIKDTTIDFTSDAASNAAGASMDSSDLADVFLFGLPLGGWTTTGSAYSMTSIAEMYTNMDGTYFYTININKSDRMAYAFVRGAQAIASADLVADPNAGIFAINNYYETDGLGSMGGAGIYATINEGILVLNIKTYDPATNGHIKNNTYFISVDSSVLTIADDNETVYIMAGDKLYASIKLIDEVDYEKITPNPACSFAKTAEVTFNNGSTVTLEDTLVASNCLSQIGVVTRAGSMEAASITIGAFSDYEIPAFGEGGEPVVVPPNFVANIDHVMSKGPNGAANYTGLAGLNGTATTDFTADGQTVGEDYIVSIGGWMGMVGGINKYVWSVDGENWNDLVSGGKDGEPLEGHYANAGLTNALKNGMFNGDAKLKANVKAYAGQTITVIFGAVSEEKGMTVPFLELKNVVVPEDKEPENPGEPDEPESKFVYVSNDELRYLDANVVQIGQAFAPGEYDSWTDKVITVEKGTVATFVDWGWVAVNTNVYQFGYIINGAEIFHDLWTVAAGDDVLAIATSKGATHASRFMGTLAEAALKVGENQIKFVVKLDNSEVVTLREYTINLVEPEPEEPVVAPTYHSSIDHVNQKGPNGSANYSNRGGTTLNTTNPATDVIDFAADGHTVGEDYIVSIGGWLGMNGGVAKYVWSVDGQTWMDILSGGTDGDPAGGSHFTGIGLTDANKNGLFNGAHMLKVNLEAYAGQTVNVTFAAVSQTNGAIAPFVTLENISVPAKRVALTVTAKDGAGNPIPGVILNLTTWGTNYTVYDTVITDENGVAVFYAQPSQNGYFVFADPIPEGYEEPSDNANFGTATEDGSAEIVFQKAPTGEKDAPLELSSWTTEYEVSIPEGGTVWYIADYPYDKMLVVNSVTIKLIVNDVEYTANDAGVVEVLLENGVEVLVGITNINGGAEDVTLQYTGKPGSSDNPFQLTELGEITVELPEDTTYNYSWTAAEDGFFYMNCSDALANINVSNATTYESVYADAETVAYMAVSAGDVINISIYAMNENWESPAATIVMTAGTAASYTEDAPLYVSSENTSVAISDTTSMNVVIRNANGMKVTFSYSDIIVTYNGQEYSPADWNDLEIVLAEDVGANATLVITAKTDSDWPTYGFEMTVSENTSSGDEGNDSNLQGSGTNEDPYMIVDNGDYSANVRTEVYYDFVAPSAGVVTITSNDGNAYISMQAPSAFLYAGAIFGSGTTSMTVPAGTAVNIYVTSYDYQADSIEFSFSFAGEGGDEGDDDAITVPGSFDAVLNSGSDVLEYTITAPIAGTLTLTANSTNCSFILIDASGYGYEWIGDGTATIDVEANETVLIGIASANWQPDNFTVTVSMPGLGEAQGTEEDPIVLDEAGEYTAEITEGGELWYTITAPIDGVMTLVPGIENNYIYLQNGDVTSDISDGATDAITIDVVAGDELVIYVSTSDAAADSVAFTVSFAEKVDSDDGELGGGDDL